MLTLETLRQENPALKIPGYEEVQTPLEAATLILYYFEDERERRDFLAYRCLVRGTMQTTDALQNDGRSIGHIAGLFQYKEELAWAGFEKIIQSIKNPKALSAEDASYLLAVAFPLDKAHGTPAMANALLGFAENIMDSGMLAAVDPVKLDMRRMPLNALHVQYTCLWLNDYLGDPDLAKDEKIKERAVQLSQYFLKYCPNDDNCALFVLDRSADNAQVGAAASDIQKAWLNSALGIASRAFPDGVTLTPRYEWLRERYQAATTKDDVIVAILADKEALNEQFPRIAPGKGLVPAVEYKPSVA